MSYKSKGSVSKKDSEIDNIEVKDEQQVSNDSEENQTKLNFQ